MGLALYALLKNAPYWLPSFLAAYHILRGGPRARRLALILWPAALAFTFFGPLAGSREVGDIGISVLVGAVLGALAGFWQSRVGRR
ncbi:hypothetical protein [Roseomonas xinghualingensis]|uniref:hypothetical protein n=1 Tax=Roseomonas xinghualingensis TaxID=2986475 RepID=UPI0021F0BC71|nr:hypothetical protein [Roseomonas sp. SXEYE001]MCV4206103.1 hypothetical protein [Roseomonas sp. SXEYE001]